MRVNQFSGVSWANFSSHGMDFPRVSDKFQFQIQIKYYQPKKKHYLNQDILILDFHNTQEALNEIDSLKNSQINSVDFNQRSVLFYK